jgi:hypothetical protein
MKYLTSYNENKSTRKNYFKNLVNSVSPTLENLFRFKILGNQKLANLVIETTGGELDRDKEFTPINHNYFGYNFSKRVGAGETEGGVSFLYEYRNTYPETIIGMCDYLYSITKGNTGVIDYKNRDYVSNVVPYFKFSISVNVDRQKYFVKIESVVKYYSIEILDVGEMSVGNHLFNIKRVDIGILLDLINKTMDKYLLKLDSKMPNISHNFQKYLNGKYKLLADMISKGSHGETSNNLNKIKEQYPDIYIELKNRIYKTGEITDMEDMHDMGFSD